MIDHTKQVVMSGRVVDSSALFSGPEDESRDDHGRWAGNKGTKSYDQVKKDLTLPNTHVSVQPQSQYGGQGGIEVRKNGYFLYHIPSHYKNRLETEGAIDMNGHSKIVDSSIPKPESKFKLNKTEQQLLDKIDSHPHKVHVVNHGMRISHGSGKVNPYGARERSAIKSLEEKKLVTVLSRNKFQNVTKDYKDEWHEVKIAREL